MFTRINAKSTALVPMYDMEKWYKANYRHTIKIIAKKGDSSDNFGPLMYVGHITDCIQVNTYR